MLTKKNNLRKIHLNPPRVLALSFAGLILLGTILLNLPIATKDRTSIGFINALFTSTSAVCVTGLAVVNTKAYWSLFGKIVILALIQTGALGFMTMATVIALVLGRKITLKNRLILREQFNEVKISGLLRLTKYIVFFTIITEGIGALLLSIRFIPIYGFKVGIWYSVFHSISAFCNAGFDITGNSFMEYVGDPLVSIVLSLLVIIGGLGFTVWIDLFNKKRLKNLNLHTKLVLSITAVLLIAGTAFIFIIEYDNPSTLKNLSIGEKFLASFFQSTITRTAGFNSVDIGSIRDTTAFIMIILMFIGGSPGSTAGGIKTTTFGTILLTTLSIVNGNRDVVVFRKRLSQNIINKSIAIIAIGISIILVVAIVLTITEEAIFLDILFETTSAFGTVGLSRGITPNLSNLAKLVISITMYIGRIGGLTLAFVFSKHNREYSFRYAEGNIIVG